MGIKHRLRDSKRLLDKLPTLPPPSNGPKLSELEPEAQEAAFELLRLEDERPQIPFTQKNDPEKARAARRFHEAMKRVHPELMRKELSMTAISKRLEEMSPFDRSGRLKTKESKKLDQVSPFRRSGVLKTRIEQGIDKASRVDRESGLPK